MNNKNAKFPSKEFFKNLHKEMDSKEVVKSTTSPSPEKDIIRFLLNERNRLYR